MLLQNYFLNVSSPSNYTSNASTIGNKNIKSVNISNSNIFSNTTSTIVNENELLDRAALIGRFKARIVAYRILRAN